MGKRKINISHARAEVGFLFGGTINKAPTLIMLSTRNSTATPTVDQWYPSRLKNALACAASKGNMLGSPSWLGRPPRRSYAIGARSAELIQGAGRHRTALRDVSGRTLEGGLAPFHDSLVDEVVKVRAVAALIRAQVGGTRRAGRWLFCASNP